MGADFPFLFIFFVFGAITGSFLNVCIMRLPRGESIAFPGSHCLKCGQPVRWFDNIPILSYFLLRGRCRACQAVFSPRYAGVEFLTALFFVLFYLIFGFEPRTFVYCVFVSLLIVATFVDFELRIIPDELSGWGIPFALTLVFFVPEVQPGGVPSDAVAGLWISSGFVLSAVFLTAVEMLFKKVSLHKEDGFFWGLVLAAFFWQAALLKLSGIWPGLRINLTAVSSALGGVIIGGGTLYVTGLIGSLLVQKRVVSKHDFFEVTDRADALFVDLRRNGYIDAGGTIQAKFRSLASADDLILEEGFQKCRKDVFDLIKGVEEAGVMGGGDVKLLALIGAFLGWPMALLTFFIAPFFGALVGIVQKIRTKSSAIAYGPYLAIAAVVSLIWGERIIAFFFAMYM